LPGTKNVALRDPQFFLEFLEHGCNVWRAKRPEAPS